jgi:hypothetical protein
MRSRRVVASGLALAAAAALAGCGETADRDFCRQYDQLVKQADEITEIDPGSASAESVRSEVADFRAELDQLGAVAEGRLDFAVSGLRVALDDLRVAAADVGGDALGTARPLLRDSLDEVRQAWAVLRTSAAAECGDS